MKCRLRLPIAVYLAAYVLLPLCSVSWYLRQEVRHRRLDRALIAAVKRRDVAAVTLLLDQAADANATEWPDEPITMRDCIRKYWDALRTRQPTLRDGPYLSALQCVYRTVRIHVPGDPTWTGDSASGGGSDFEIVIGRRTDPGLIIGGLLTHGARFDPSSATARTLLTNACFCGDADAVSVLLRYHVNPNLVASDNDENKYPPLMYVRDSTCARLLLQAGASADARGPGGMTRLMNTRDATLVSALLAYGADPNARDNEGRNVLRNLDYRSGGAYYLVQPGLQILLDHGARVSARDTDGRTALDYARAQWVDWLNDPDRRDMRSHYYHNLGLLEAAMKREMEEAAKVHTSR